MISPRIQLPGLPPTAGTYTLDAVAIDNRGRRKISAGRTVTVTAAGSSSREAAKMDEGTFSSSVAVYPNAVSDAFHITLKDIVAASVSVYDPSSKVLYQSTQPTQCLRLSKSGNLTTGLYIIQVIDQDQNVHHQKLMIK